MPKIPINYQNTIIYIIKCKDDNITEEYVGSTTNFKQRKREHKSRYNNEKSKTFNELKYKFIRENGGWSNWLMLEVEKYPCNDKREAERREEEIRVERKAKLNSNKAFSAETKQEYRKQHYEENKDKIKEQTKIYRKEHKEEIKEHQKLYRKEHKEEIKEISKKYYEENKNKIKEQKKIYYEEQIKEQRKTKKWTCLICNKEMREDSKNRHNRTIH